MNPKKAAGDRCSYSSFSNFETGVSLTHRRVPMDHLYVVPRFGQPFLDLFGNQYRAVLASGAAERDGEVALAFANVMRDQVNQQLRNPRDKFLGLREGQDVARHLRVAPGERTELRNKVGIGQEAHVEHQVGVFRDALTK